MSYQYSVEFSGGAYRATLKEVSMNYPIVLVLNVVFAVLLTNIMSYTAYVDFLKFKSKWAHVWITLVIFPCLLLLTPTLGSKLVMFSIWYILLHYLQGVKFYPTQCYRLLLKPNYPDINRVHGYDKDKNPINN